MFSDSQKVEKHWSSRLYSCTTVPDVSGLGFLAEQSSLVDRVIEVSPPGKCEKHQMPHKYINVALVHPKATIGLSDEMKNH